MDLGEAEVVLLETDVGEVGEGLGEDGSSFAEATEDRGGWN